MNNKGADQWSGKYCKCSNISNSFLFLFSITMLVLRAGINKMLVRIANREDPAQTASSRNEINKQLTYILFLYSDTDRGLIYTLKFKT